MTGFASITWLFKMDLDEPSGRFANCVYKHRTTGGHL